MEQILSVLDMIWKIVFIIFFFGFCIFIHEFGHLLVALKMGLHVEKFSVGFGRRIWGFKRNGVEYIIGWLPFGGYVSLPQLDPTDKPTASGGKELEPGKPVPRAATAFAGPFFNVLFGFALAAVMWVAGVWEAPPANSCVVTSVPETLPKYENGLKVTDTITALDGKETSWYLEELCIDMKPDGEPRVITVQRGDKSMDFTFIPEPNPEYAAGLRRGDRITAVNGKPFTKGAEELAREYVYNSGPEVEITVIRDGEELKFTYTPMPNPLVEGLGAPFFNVRNPLAVGAVTKDSPADKAGIRPGDQLLQLNSTNIINGADFLGLLGSTAGSPFTLLVSRSGKEVTIGPVDAGEQPSLSTLGLNFAVTISQCIPGKPGDKAGLRRGDRVVRINNEEVLDSRHLTALIAATKGDAMSLDILRDGKELMIPDVRCEKITEDGKDRWVLGVVLSDNPPKIIAHPNPWVQFTRIVSQTQRTLGLLFTPLTAKLGGRAAGKATVKMEHMSGPLGIVMMLWYSLKAEGIRGGLSLIILISFSLAIMNLLPVPVLDGGHIMFALVEIIIRRRLPAKLVLVLQNAFAFMLIGMILYISFFDGRRLLRLFRVGSMKSNPPKVQKVEEVKKAVPQIQGEEQK